MKHKNSGFTIVELLVGIVIISIIIIVIVIMISYFGVTDKANSATLRSDLNNASTVLKLYNAKFGSYPDTGTLSATRGRVCLNRTSYCFNTTDSNTIVSYTGGTNTYTLQMSQGTINYRVTESTSPALYVYVPTDGSYIQTITAANCPSTRIRAVDARDDHTYWVQKLSNGKCWMLTNLGYAGGGTDTYGDATSLSDGTNDRASTYTVAKYYIPIGSNVTTEPTAPSISTNGTGQYGYLYNYCAANGGQAGNGACSRTDSTEVDRTISICPSGWRLPFGKGGDFADLNATVNGNSSKSEAGLIKDPWLGQFSGLWYATGFLYQGAVGYYWSSSQRSLGQKPETAGYTLSLSRGWVDTAVLFLKHGGYAVRCIAS